MQVTGWHAPTGQVKGMWGGHCHTGQGQEYPVSEPHLQNVTNQENWGLMGKWENFGVFEGKMGLCWAKNLKNALLLGGLM